MQETLHGYDITMVNYLRLCHQRLALTVESRKAYVRRSHLNTPGPVLQFNTYQDFIDEYVGHRGLQLVLTRMGPGDQRSAPALQVF